MLREPILTSEAPQPIGPYSQAISAQGRLVFISGQIPLTPSGELLAHTIEEQTTQVMKNLHAVVLAAGLTMGNIVKTTIFLSTMENFPAVNGVYATFFDQAPPARSTVAVAGLPRNVLVEIEAIAVAQG